MVDLNGEHGLHLDPVAVAYSKRQWFMEHLDELELIEEVVAFARKWYGKVPLAVATGGTRLVAEKTIFEVGLSDLFDEVVTSDDITAGKPAPDVYLEAARRLGMDPEKCLAVEDAPAGIMAAQSAGMKVVVVPETLQVH